jgi:hypothetical protein
VAKKVVILIVVLLLVAGGFFWWQEYQKEKKLEEMTVGELFKFRVLPKGFVVDETSEGIFLENQDIGINFKVPKNWELVGYMEDFIDLKSSDYEADPITFDRLKGCLITMEVSYYTLFTSSNLINRIDRIKKENNQFQDEGLIKISGRDALKSVRKDEWLAETGIKEIIEVGIPFLEPKVEVKFSTKIFKEGSRCYQEFNQFLETVSIQ